VLLGAPNGGTPLDKIQGSGIKRLLLDGKRRGFRVLVDRPPFSRLTPMVGAGFVSRPLFHPVHENRFYGFINLDKFVVGLEDLANDDVGILRPVLGGNAKELFEVDGLTRSLQARSAITQQPLGSKP